MATLVLTAVGTAIGGPLGGALGAIVGQQIDQNIFFKPKGREGPRLQELAVQTSSYGTQIPRIYGKMRVAGTVIWATDLKETKQSEGGGKGRPKTTTYSYSACLAVALSSRDITGIGWIWADGKIFRGSAGDFKTETGFRFHNGYEDQVIDSLIASAEGQGAAPAHRGIALAIFEDMDLTEYGNRIPSLTFEVIADDGSVTIGQIISDISDAQIASNLSIPLHGFAASGENRRTALNAVAQNFPISFITAHDGMQAVNRQIAGDELDASISVTVVRETNGTVTAKPEQQTLPETSIARQVSLRYYEPTRDYQSGMQNAFRPGLGRAIINRDFPAAISTGQAKSIAQNMLFSIYQERTTARLEVIQANQNLRPGALVRIADTVGFWRVRSSEIKNGVIMLQLVKAINPTTDISEETDQGRAVLQVDALAGPTRLILVDLPFAINAPFQPSEIPRLYAVAAGGAGWRKAQLFNSDANGNADQPIAEILPPATIGTATQVLGLASANLVDEKNGIEVSLHHAGMQLHDADDSRLFAGANATLLGAELIQFGRATPLGNGRYRLSRLLRGLGGTEDQIAGHEVGENFILLNVTELIEIDPVHFTPFVPAAFWALGRGDEQPVLASHDMPGHALRPLSPAHPRISWQIDGSLEIGWTRRSRAGALWRDSVEVPLAEEFELYRLNIASDAGGAVANIDTANPYHLMGFTSLQDLRSNGVSHLLVEIRQIGSHTISPPLGFPIPI